MGAFQISGIHTLAVRESELVQLNFDPANPGNEGRSWEIVSLRTLQGGFGQEHVFGPTRRKLDIQKFLDILGLAERLTSDPTAGHSLLLFLEATTHLANAEYAQSYVMAWTILEMSIAALWRRVLTEKGIKGPRLDKLSDRWSADDIIESLSLVNALTIEDYEELIRLKRARNVMLHRGKDVNRDEAERCLNYAGVWLKRMLPENGGHAEGNPHEGS